MRIDSLYRVSVFGNFSDINPTAENMKFFFDEFNNKNLVPNIFQEIKISNQLPYPQNKIMLVDLNQKVKITIGEERIDYIFNLNEDAQMSIEMLENCNQDLVNYFEIILNNFNKKGCRLALNSEHLFIDMSEEKFTKFINKFSNPINIYKDKQQEDWMTRLVCRNRVDINNNEELLNIITILEKRLYTQSSSANIVPGIYANLDINTFQENRDTRFKSDDIESFIKSANSIKFSILEDLEGSFS